jgi:DNA-binding transcriptional LysR family regulator
MHLDLLGIEAFITVAQVGSFRRASDQLGISQPALSRRLQRLERILGCELFVRTARPVRLTKAGENLLPEAESSLAALSKAMRQVGKESNRQLISIGCIRTVASRYLGEVLVRHQRAWPQSAVQIHDESPAEIFKLLAEGKIDFGVSLAGSERWDIEATPLFEDPFHLICPIGHRLAGRGVATWHDIGGEPMVAISPHNENHQLITSTLHRVGIDVNWQFEVIHIPTAVQLVAAGAALAVVPALTVADLSKVAIVPLIEPAIRRSIGILQRRGHDLPPAAEALRKSLVSTIKADQQRKKMRA